MCCQRAPSALRRAAGAHRWSKSWSRTLARDRVVAQNGQPQVVCQERVKAIRIDARPSARATAKFRSMDIHLRSKYRPRHHRSSFAVFASPDPRDTHLRQLVGDRKRDHSTAGRPLCGAIDSQSARWILIHAREFVWANPHYSSRVCQARARRCVSASGYRCR